MSFTIHEIMDNHDFDSATNNESDFIKNGRNFLKGLMLNELRLIRECSSINPSDLVIQIRNWQRVVALILRKLSAAYEGTADVDFHIKKVVFKLDVKSAQGSIRGASNG
jgi:hypothetical protein